MEKKIIRTLDGKPFSTEYMDSVETYSESVAYYVLSVGHDVAVECIDDGRIWADGAGIAKITKYVPKKELVMVLKNGKEYKEQVV